MASDRERAKRAITAMRSIGVSDERTKAALKKLLKVFDKNWDLIEEESYRALADSIFQEEEEDVVDDSGSKCTSEDAGNATGDEPEQHLTKPERRSARKVAEDNLNSSPHQGTDKEAPQDTPRPLKRLRRGGQTLVSPSPESTSRPGGIILKEPKIEAEEAPGTYSGQQSRVTSKSRQLSVVDSGAESLSAQPQENARNKGKELVTSNAVSAQERVHPSLPCTAKKTQTPAMGISQTNAASQVAPVEGSSNPAHSKKSLDKTDKLILAKYVPETGMLITPKEEPMMYEISPDKNPISIILPDQLNENLSDRNLSVGESNMQDPSPSRSPSKPVNGNSEGDVIVASASKKSPNFELAVANGGSSHLEITSSPSKDVKISVSIERQDVKAFSLEELLKSFEEKCIRSYKILDPNFSAMNLLNSLVESVIEVGTSSADQPSRPGSDHSDQEREILFDVSPSVDLLNKSTAREVLSVRDSSNFFRPYNPHTTNGAVSIQYPVAPNESDSSSLVVVPERPTADDMRTMICKDDITKGEESVNIPWVNEVNKNHPQPFYYISQNFIFQSARVDFTLSHIKEDRCCSGCFGNCLESVINCACSQETGSQFAYTKEGVLREEFLEECICANRDPKQGCVFYCEECPVEILNGDMEPCKGHLTRKFIKECWSKCGCSKQCGNRVVQRGITCKLEVFYSTEGKGWGLRTLEALPKGAFVCEYVGEIVTCAELHSRKMRDTYHMQNIHPVLLDSDWSSAILKDEEALCLDATSYGNVARFINHRCLDANLIEIPVEIDTTEHHYYHLAFFTTREVKAQEELTWDYGVYSEDHGHLSKAFQCKCGSKFCRNMKRPTRSRA